MTATRTEAPGDRTGVARSASGRSGWLLVAVVALGLVTVASIAVGAKDVPLHDTVHALLHGGRDDNALIIIDLRLPRTLLGLLAGAALGVAGALIQAMTRNPLADPGILGVNAGAAFLVVIAVAVFGLTGIWSYLWFAFAGAILATVAVYLIGSAGRGGATPVRLTLAGVALGAVLTGIGSGLRLLNPRAFDAMRYWQAGSLSGRPMSVVLTILPFIAVGLAIALCIAGPLNAVALGDDLASALGAHLGRTRILGVVAVTLLCGAATAAVGPIGFVGLMIPHVARWLTGPDQRWILAYTVVLAPILLLASDILGRVVLRPGELQVGIVTSCVGAPVLIWLVRHRRASGL